MHYHVQSLKDAEDAARSPMKILIFTPPDADDRRHHADPRAVDADRCVSWWLSGVLAVLLFGGFLGVILGWRPPAGITLALGAAVFSVFVAVTWFLQWYPKRFFACYAYRLRPDWVEVRKGICFRRIVAVPRSRIQHIDVARGPIARSYGIAKVVLHTAGSMYADVTIEGLAAETAFRIRDKLIEERKTRDA
jgi:hypothetical protein